MDQPLSGTDALSRPQDARPNVPEHAAPPHVATSPEPDSLVLHALFETQADARPDHVAIIADHQSMTYAELEAHANRLARHLRRQIGRAHV